MKPASKMLKFKAKRSPFQTAMLAMLCGILTAVALWSIPTQWFAAMVGYDRGLGEPLWIGATFAVYAPFDWLEWGWRLAEVPHLKGIVEKMQLMGHLTTAVGLIATFGYIFLLKSKPEGMDELHGSAYWADLAMVDSTGYLPSAERQAKGAMIGSVMLDSKNEIIHPMHPNFSQRYLPLVKWKQAGLKISRQRIRDKDGVPEVKINKKFVKRTEYLWADDATHILAFAPTRSGKGVGLVLPTLLTWRHSTVVNDIKGECWAITSGFRQRVGQIVMKFEPACQDGSTACWNPLDEIRAFTENDVQDAQGLMMMVCDPKGEGLEDHWAKTSWEFLSGLALHLRYAGGSQSSIAGMAAYLGSPEWTEEKQMYTTMQNHEHDPDGKMGWRDSMGNPTKTHPAVANVAATMLMKEDKERTSVLSTAKSFLSLYLDPIVARNTSRSDFLVRDLMNSDRPVSLYFVVQPNDLDRMVPLSRLFWSMVIKRNTDAMSFKDGTSVQGYKHRLLLMIDELPSMKKLSVLQEGLGYIAGYGLKCYLICQDTIQLEQAYGKEQTIFAGCHVRIAYAPNTSETAQKLSEMTGKTTVIEEKHSDSASSWGLKADNVSISTDKVERALMTPDEFLALSPRDMVIFVAGRRPIYGAKPIYYADKVLKGRAMIPAPAVSDKVRVSGQATAVEAADKAKEEVRSAEEARMLESAEAKRRDWARRTRMLAQGDVSVVEARMGRMDRGLAGVDVGLGGLASGEVKGGDAPAGKPSGDSTSGDSSTGKRRSFYADKGEQDMSPEEQEMLKQVVAQACLADQVVAFKVF